LPLLEKTNGRYGCGRSVAQRSDDSQSAYAWRQTWHLGLCARTGLSAKSSPAPQPL